MKPLTPQFWSAVEALRNATQQDVVSLAKLRAEELIGPEASLIVGFSYIVVGDSVPARQCLTKPLFPEDSEGHFLSKTLLTHIEPTITDIEVDDGESYRLLVARTCDKRLSDLFEIEKAELSKLSQRMLLVVINAVHSLLYMRLTSMKQFGVNDYDGSALFGFIMKAWAVANRGDSKDEVGTLKALAHWCFAFATLDAESRTKLTSIIANGTQN